MIEIVTRQFSPEEWTETISAFNDLSLMQTWEYAEAKAQASPWKVDRAIFVKAGNVIGAAQAMVRRVPWSRNGLVWISRGPLWRREENARAAEGLAMLDALRKYWVDERGMYLRILPTFLEAEVPANSFAEIGYRGADRAITWSSAVVDLTQTRETLRGRLQQKWRNCLNKAEREGIVIESGTAENLFREMLVEYRQMLADKSFASVITPILLTRLQSSLPEERQLWSLVARQGEQRLGAILVARYGKASEYFVGAVNDSGRALNAGQLLLWQALCQMKDMGFESFDVGGTDSTRTPKGVLHFKNGIGGLRYALNCEIEAFKTSLVTRAIRWRVTRERQLT